MEIFLNSALNADGEAFNVNSDRFMGNMDKGLSTFILSWQGYKSIMMQERGKPRVPESLDGSMNFSVKAFIVNFDKGPIWDHSRILITYSVVFENPGPQGFAEITLHSKPGLVLPTWLVCFVLDFTANSNFSYLFLVLIFFNDPQKR